MKRILYIAVLTTIIFNVFLLPVSAAKFSPLPYVDKASAEDIEAIKEIEKKSEYNSLDFENTYRQYLIASPRIFSNLAKGKNIKKYLSKKEYDLIVPNIIDELSSDKNGYREYRYIDYSPFTNGFEWSLSQYNYDGKYEDILSEADIGKINEIIYFKYRGIRSLKEIPNDLPDHDGLGGLLIEWELYQRFMYVDSETGEYLMVIPCTHHDLTNKYIEPGKLYPLKEASNILRMDEPDEDEDHTQTIIIGSVAAVLVIVTVMSIIIKKKKHG